MIEVEFVAQEQIAVLTLQDQDPKKIHDGVLGGQIEDACNAIKENDDLRGVVITSLIDGFLSIEPRISRPVDFRDLATMTNLIADIEKPTIAAIEYGAHGEGLELVLSCDIRVASLTSLFSQPQILGGLMP